MDSLTQIVLGAAVGEAVAGKKMGAKAALWGAVAGTLPDLDVFFTPFFDPLDAALVHRGFSHSLLFAVLTAPLLGWIFHKLYKGRYERKVWIRLWFLGIVTHPLLDIFTNYGTQFLWPFSWRITFNSVFVIDPLYTVPFMICVIVALFIKREKRSRTIWNWSGIIWSCTYLLWGIAVKLTLLNKSDDYFAQDHIRVTKTMVTPMPLTSFYWLMVGEDKYHYHVGYKSLFGNFRRQELQHIRKNHQLLKGLTWKGTAIEEKVDHLTNGFYSLEKGHDTIYCYDLRFGTLTQMTDGTKTNPIMGYGFIVHQKRVQKIVRLRGFGGVNGRTFAVYLKKTFGA